MWVKAEIEAGGIKKEVELKLLTVKEFFEVKRYAEQLEKADNLTEEQMLEVLKGLVTYIKGVDPETDPLVFSMAAIRKLVEANTLTYEDFKKKSETKSQQGGLKR